MVMTSANSDAVGVGGGGALFVYGSLLADDVVQLLLNRVPQTSPAILNGYHRFSIKGRVYPAILPVENKNVTGRVLIGLSAMELDILDEYEAEEYDKRVVDVSFLDTSKVLQAYTYVWGNSTNPYLYGEWDFEDFKQSKLKDYVERTKSPRDTSKKWAIPHHRCLECNTTSIQYTFTKNKTSDECKPRSYRYSSCV